MSSHRVAVSELQETLAHRLQKLQKHLGADVLTLHLYDSQRNRLHFPVAVGLSQLEERFTRSMPRMGGIAESIIRTQESLIVNDVETQPQITSSFTYVERVRALAGFPLIVPESDVVVGLLFINYRELHSFDKEEIAWIHTQIKELAEWIHGLFQGDRGQELQNELRHQADVQLKEVRLNGIVSQLWEVLGDVDVAFLTQRPGEKKLYIETKVGFSDEFVEAACVNLQDENIVSKAFREKDEALVESSRFDPAAIFNTSSAVDWKCMLAAPVSTGGPTLGVLVICRREAAQFTRRERDVINAFESLLALTIENEERIIALSAVQDIGIRIASQLDRDELLETILDRALELFECDVGTIALQDPITEDLVFKYDKPEGKAGYVLPTGEGLMSVAARTRRSVRVGDVTQAPHYHGLFEKTRSEMDIPLTVGDTLIGVLNVESPYLDAFSAEDEQVAVALASQAAVAIYNAELFEQRRVLGDIAKDIASELNRDTLIARIIQRSVQLIECKVGALGLVDVETGDIVYQHQVGDQTETIQPLKYGEGLTHQAVTNGAPVRVGDVSQEPAYVARITDTKSEMIVPLKIGDSILGVLDFQTPRLNAFSEHDEDLALALADLAAAALYNAQLFEKTQERLAQRLNDIQALQSVYDAIGHEELDTVLTEITKLAVRLTPAQFGNIWLLEPGREELRFGTEFNLFDVSSRLGNRIPVDENSINGWVALHGEPYLCPDVSQDSHYQSVLAVVRTELTVPLRYRGQIIGTLDVASTESGAFDDDHQQLLMALAGQAATAIEIARLYERQKTLADIGRITTSTLDLDKLLQRVLEETLEALDAKYGTLRLWNRATDTLTLNAYVGPAKDRILEDIPLDKGITGWVARNNEMLYLPDISKDDRYINKKDTKSAATVPISIGERVIGVINAEHLEVDAFDANDLNLLKAIAGQAAAPIQNARLYERQQALAEINQAIASTLDLDEVLQRLLDEAKRALGGVYGTLRLLNRSKNALELKTRSGEVTNASLESIPMGEGVTGTVAERMEPILVTDALKDARYVPFLADARSAVTVPIKTEDRLVGVLNIEHPRPNAFDAEDLSLLQAIAAQATAAIRNAQEHEAAEAINELGQILRSRLTEEEIVERIHEHADRIMDTDNMYIALYDAPTDTVSFALAFMDGKRVDIDREKGYQPRQGGKGRTEYIIHHKEHILDKTKKESEEWYKKPGHEEYAGWLGASWLGVPMVLEDSVIGVIATFHTAYENVYSEDDKRSLQMMADQAAVALDNARMYYRVNRRLETLTEFGRSITAELGKSELEIVRLVYHQARGLMDVDNMYIAIYDEKTERVWFPLAFKGGEPLDVAPRQGGRGRTEYIIEKKEPLFISTKEKSLEWYEEMAREYVEDPLGSWIGVPMMVGERVVGVIATYHPTRDYVYSGEDLGILQALANYAAIALENARLYEAAREEVIASKQLASLGVAMSALQHRVNNSFNIIIPNMTRLKKRVDVEDETIAEIIDIVERNARYTSDIIGRILRQLQHTELQQVDINAILTEVLSVAQGKRRDANLPPIDFDVSLDASMPLIKAPTGQIAEVFQNLVDNASRVLTQKEDKLTIESQHIYDMIEVRVRDTGPGISPEIQERLFNKPVPSKEPGGGAGVGLWLNKLILESIGAKIGIEKSDKTGTTMLVQIPVSPAVQSQEAGQ